MPESSTSAGVMGSSSGFGVLRSIGGVPAPTYVPAGQEFTVPADTQILFALPIRVDGMLIVDGALVEVN